MSDNGWISVDERLPEMTSAVWDEDVSAVTEKQSEWVLVWGKVSMPMMGYCVINRRQHTTIIRWYAVDGGEIATVTHWQPLPPPPEATP